jgi:hypothetical protein
MQARKENRWRLSLLIAGVLLMGCSAACDGSPTKAGVASPTPDSVTRNYVGLVYTYWLQYKTAEANAGVVCFGGGANELRLVNPSTCRERSISIVAVHVKFLSDLNGTLPPPRFARDDRIFRSQLPEAVADVKAMISAADTGSQDAVLVATIAYVNDMIPTVTDALDDVDPSVAHAHN